MIDEPLSKLTLSNMCGPIQWSSLNRKEARMHHKNLIDSLPGELAYLRDVMQEDSVKLGFGPREDALAAGEWVIERCRLVEVKMPDVSDPFWDDRPELSIPSRSACWRVGLFFGDCLIRHSPHIKWALDLSGKRHIYYQQTVLVAPGSPSILEPTTMVMNVAWRRVYEKKAVTLGDLFDIWTEHFAQN